jgi:cation diffusion facilitator family transporter
LPAGKGKIKSPANAGLVPMNDTAKLKEKAALVSIAASALLTLGKLIAGLLSGSLALLSEAAHGLLDTGATILTWFAVKAADKPADEKHHYGHGKIEAVAALIETGLLMLLAGGVVFEAARRLFANEAHSVEATWLTYGVLIVSIIVDFVRWRSLAKIAHETRSDALAADALHFSSDLVASACVLAGLVAMQFGFKHGDTLAAAGVAIFIAIAGYRLGKRTFQTLTDAAPLEITNQIRKIVEATPGVIDIEDLRMRPAGSSVFGEISIAVGRTLPAERIVAVREAVSRAIVEKFPHADVTVRATPRALDNETVLERVLLTAARRRLAVHHVTVQQVEGRTSVSLDLEVDGRMTQGAAHDIASGLEDAIQAELGMDVEVETHIEPLEIRELEGRDADPAMTQKIADALIARAAESGPVDDVHDVRVRHTEGGYVVNYHCRIDAEISVLDAHTAVDQLDHRVRTLFPDVIRVVGHAEPKQV